MKKEKAVKGGVYLTIVNVVSQLLSTVLSVILARLLAPEDFGLMALVLTFLGFIELFTKIGFGSAIIQKKNPSQTQISTLYWINLFFGVITLVIIIVGTPWFARFYDSPRLNEIMWIAALSVVITPTYMIHYKLLEKDLKFGLLSRANMVASICGAVGATLAALSGLGVIALIVQALVGKLTKGLIVLHGNSWRPSLIFNFSEVKDMLVFSLKFKLSQSLLYVDRNIDYLILGKFFSSAVLGYYSFAYTVMYTPVKRISSIFNDVMFPALSSIQDDPKKVVRGYFKSVELVAIISFPLMTLIALHTELILHFFFGTKWDGAIPIVKILCVAGAVQSISQLSSVVFNSLGKPMVDFYFGIIRNTLTILAIVAGSQYGIEIVAWYLLVVKVLSFIIGQFVIYRLVKFSILLVVDYLGKAILVCLIMLIINFLNNWLGLSLILMFLISILTAATGTLVLNRKLLSELFILLKKKI